MKPLNPIVLLIVVTVTSHAVCGAQTPTPTPTIAPTPTWFPSEVGFTVAGTVYDASFGLSSPIAGATVAVEHFGSGPSRSETTTSATDGSYRISMMGHDTNSVFIDVKAEGYHDYHNSLGSVMEQWLADPHNVGMTRIATPVPIPRLWILDGYGQVRMLQ